MFINMRKPDDNKEYIFYKNQLYDKNDFIQELIQENKSLKLKLQKIERIIKGGMNHGN